MALKQLFTTSNLIKAFNAIDREWREPRRRHKLLFENVNVEDVLFHCRAIAKTIAHEIKQEKYRYQPVRGTFIQVGKKQREIFPLELTDYVVHRVMYQFFAKKFEPFFSPQLLSYRKGRSAHQGITQLAQWIKAYQNACPAGSHQDFFVYQTDLSNYTDSIPTDEHGPLWSILNYFLTKAEIGPFLPYEEYLLRHAIVPTIRQTDHKTRMQGVLMGSPFANLVANCYLNQLDHEISACKGGLYFRYGDDIFFIHQHQSVVLEKIEIIRAHLQSLGLAVHPEKDKLTYLTKAGRAAISKAFIGRSSIDFLGYAITARGGVSIKRGKMKEMINLIRHRIKTTLHLFRHDTEQAKIKALCSIINTLLLGEKSWLPDDKFREYLYKINDRDRLKQLDYLIAFEIAKAITGIRSVKAFRYLPYKELREKYQLLSVIVIRDRELKHAKNSLTVKSHCTQ